MKTRLTYQGISIDFIKTQKWSQEVIYDPSHTDKIYTRLNIVVRGIIPEDCSGSPGSCRSSQRIAAIREKLLTPRGKLVYEVGGKAVIISPVGTNSRDENNGPKPIRFDVVDASGGQNLHVEFEIETWINECGSGGGCSPGSNTPNTILSNRFSVSMAIDTNFLWTRTIRGIVIVSGAAVQDVTTQPDWGTLINFPIPNRWKRDDISVECLPDGLTWNYQIVDKELNMAIPKPATSIDATYRQSFGALGNAGLVQNDISVTVQGEPECDFADLAKIACQVIFSRIKLAQGKLPQGVLKGAGNVHGGFAVQGIAGAAIQRAIAAGQSDDPADKSIEWITSGEISEDIFNRKLTISLKTNSSPNTTTLSGMQLPLHRFGQPVNIDDVINNVPRTPSTRFKYWGCLLANQLANPCEPRYPYYQGQYPTGDSNVKPKVYTTSHTDYKYPVQADGKTGYDQKQTVDYPYPLYDIYTRFESDTHTFQLPVCNSKKNQPAQFSTVAGKSTKKIISWTAVRIGKPPDVPDPGEVSKDGNDVFLYSKIQTPTVQLESDGYTKRYTLHGEYTFGMKKPLDTSQDIPYPRNPMLTGTIGDVDYKFPKDSFKSDIAPINNGKSSSGGTN